MKPKIYVFCNQKGCTGGGDWHNGAAIAEDGTFLQGHVSSNHSFLRHDLGGEKHGWKRENYDKHYPDGYEIVFLFHENGDDVAGVLASLPNPEAEPK